MGSNILHRKGSIYAHRLIPTGQIYVGQVTMRGGWRTRWQQEVREVRRGKVTTILRSAIAEYGTGDDAWDHDYIEQGISRRDELNQAEKDYILAFSAHMSMGGLCMTWGGSGQIGPRVKWRTFKKARGFVHSLGLKNQEEWKQYAKSDKRPNDIPAIPDRVYRQFKGLGDWLGTGSVSTNERVYRSFGEACEFVHSLGLKNTKEWQTYVKCNRKPDDIPAAPFTVYADQWQGFGDWLGTGRIADKYKVFQSFENARDFSRGLGLKNRGEWEVYRISGKKPDDIPSAPSLVYGERWQGWGDWLGTGNITPKNKVFRSFEEARLFIQALGLKNEKEWKRYTRSGKKPKDIPTNPYQVYPEQWRGVGDWLGTGVIASRDKVFRPFEEARAFLHRVGLKSHKEWVKYSKSKRPDDIPSAPNKTYATQWINWPDFLGTC